MGLEAINILPGVVKDDTDYSSSGWCVESDQMRIVRGVFETMGGWSNACLGQTILGPIRGSHAWADDNGIAYAAAGSWIKLYVQQNDIIYDITPIVSFGALTDALSTIDGSTDVSVALTAHGLVPQQFVHLSAASPVGGVQIGSSGIEGPDAFYSNTDSAIVVVSHPGHNRSTGDIVDYAGTTSFNGLTGLDGEYSIFVIDADSFQFQANTTATASGFGGGSPTFVYYDAFQVQEIVDADHFTVSVASPATSTATGGGAVDYKVELAPGLLHGTVAGGYGLGTYGEGPYGGGAGTTGSVGAGPPRVWSMDNYGSYLVCNPIGETIFMWPPLDPTVYTPPNLSKRAGALANAPLRVNSIVVTNERFIVALGCNDAHATGPAVGGIIPYDRLGIFEPLLERWTGDPKNPTIWDPQVGNLASSNFITSGSKLVGGKRTTPNGFLCWTDTSCIYNAYTSNPQGLYQPLPEGSGCGLVGPLAVIEKDGKAFWMTPSGDYFEYNGSSVAEIQSACRQFVFKSIDPLQAYKITATYDAAWVGVEWRYPANSVEINSYIRVDLNSISPSEPRAGWSVGSSVFSDSCDRSVYPNPIGYGLDGVVYWRESGTSADGSPIARKLYTAWSDASTLGLAPQGSRGDHVVNLNRVVMDGEQTGVINVTFQARKWPRDPNVTTKGPYQFTSDSMEQRFRIQGRQIRIEFDWNGVNDYFRFGTILMDAADGPRR